MKKLTIFIVFIILGLATALVYVFYKSARRIDESTTELSVPSVSEVGFSTPEGTKSTGDNDASAPVAQIKIQSNFQQLLSEQCKDRKIAIDLLPFKFTPAIYTKYKLDKYIDCYPNSIENIDYEGSMSVFSRVGKGDDGHSSHVLFVGDKFSKDFGMDHYFFIVKQEKPVITVGKVSVFINVLQPGPWGLSDLGVFLEVVAFRQIGDYYIIASENPVLEVSGEILDLMKKYADDYREEDELSNIPEAPKYTANSRYKEFESEFIQKYFSKYPNNTQLYRNYVDNVIRDVESVSLR